MEEELRVFPSVYFKKVAFGFATELKLDVEKVENVIWQIKMYFFVDAEQFTRCEQ